MKALILDEPGSPDMLYVSEMPEPHPAAGEVRVKVHAAGLNPADYKFARRGIASWKYPHVLVDTVSSGTATTGLDLLAFGGGIACVAALPDLSHFQSFGRALSVHDIALGGAYLSGDRSAQAKLAQLGRELGELVSQRTITPMLQEVIRLQDIPEGLTRLTHRHVRGKIVAQIRP